MNDTKIKRQITDKVTSSTNILIAMSNDPSVDELSAAIGLTLMLNKLNKHVTTVFSGAIPPAIKFLKPEKTFESTADSLRDFIIALDKEKADHLRYKLEDGMVKIFITPYKTKITPEDLEYSQGDYNVDLIIALGVEDRANLDHALASHGGVLHDATVITVMVGEKESNLGSIALHNKNSSSLCEELSGLDEALKGEAATLIDKTVATALLTGIVSATERFSNPRTSSRTMTIAAKLMSAGADQQLIASKLAEPKPTQSPVATDASGASEVRLQEGVVTRLSSQGKGGASKTKREHKDLDIDYDQLETLEDVAGQVVTQDLDEAARLAEQALGEQGVDVDTDVSDTAADEQPTGIMDIAHEAPAAPPSDAVATPPQPAAPMPPLPEVIEPPAQMSPVQPAAPAVEPSIRPLSTLDAPTMGGTLNATTEQAEATKRRELEADKNKTILKHTYLGDSQPIYDSPINGATDEAAAEAPIDIFANNQPPLASALEPDTLPTVEAQPVAPAAPNPAPPLAAAPPLMTADPTLAVPAPAAPAPDDVSGSDAARQAVEAALMQSMNAAPAAAPAAPMAPPPTMGGDMSLPPPPPPPMPSMMDGGGLPMPPTIGYEATPVPGMPVAAPVSPVASGLLGDILAAESETATFGHPTPAQAPYAPIAPAPAAPTAPADPGQFRIPGQ